MPQHVIIEDGGICTARLRTSNKGGTLYDVLLRVEAPACEWTLENVDTGVQRQPREAAARGEDFRCDFVHAKRAIAAAVATADRFAIELAANSGDDQWNGTAFRVRIRTNNFDRGFIEVVMRDADTWAARLNIGGGPQRVSNATPEVPQQFEWIPLGPRPSGPLAPYALRMFQEAGNSFLQDLDAHIG